MRLHAMLLFLCLAWASIYPLVKVAERDFGPITLMGVRAATAAVCMLAVALVTRRSLRVTRRHHGLLLILSFLNVTLIWVAISVAEEHLSSSLTALLTALIPIGTFLLNAFVLRTERPGLGQVLGLILALAGLVMVLGPDRLTSGKLDLVGLLLMVVGCLGYAAGGILVAARGRELDPVVTTTWSLSYATGTLLALSLLVEHPFSHRPPPDALLAVLAAGSLATALPNLIYYHLVREAGPQFASLFGYGLPVCGVLMGIVFMRDPVTPWLLPGLGLILAGLALVRRRF